MEGGVPLPLELKKAVDLMMRKTPGMSSKEAEIIVKDKIRKDERDQKFKAQVKDKRDKATAARRAPAMAQAAENSATLAGIGNRDRSDAVKGILRLFAKSDFAHDFGEKDTGRDLITYADRKRFSEMVQKLSVKERTALLNMFDAKYGAGRPYAAGDNLYSILKGTIASNLYPEPLGDDSEFVDEPTVMKQLNIKYTEIKDSVKAAPPVPGSPFEQSYTFGTPTTPRNYIVRAQYYKNEDRSTRNLASLFKDATGGATKFALLIDASLGMSVTLAGDSRLKPDPGAPCKFVILQNVESDADSATGATDFKIEGGGVNSSTVEIFRDVDTSTVVFPTWPDVGISGREAENLFSKIQIVMNRVEKGEIEASIIVPGGESHNISDVGTASNVKNASLNALEAIFLNGIPGANPSASDRRRPYIFALLKRMGDWCQALSLLDRSRVYESVDIKTGKRIGGVGSQTLQGLSAEGYEIGLVTNDRILLAYAVFLGVNVYFTTASDLSCLLYFKNQDDLPDDAAIETRTNAIVKNVLLPLLGGPVPTLDAANALVNARKAAAIASLAVPGIKAVKDELKVVFAARPEIKDKPAAREVDAIAEAFAAKVYLANLGELSTTFDDLSSHMQVYFALESTLKQKFDAVTQLVNILNKYNTAIAHNQAVVARMTAGEYSGQYQSHALIFVDLAVKMATAGRITGSEQMARAKDILLSIRDDIKQVSQKTFPFAINIAAYIPSTAVFMNEAGPVLPLNDKDVSNFTSLYGAFDAVRKSIPMAGGGQQGGAIIPPVDLFNSLLQRQIYPFTAASIERVINQLEKQKGSAMEDAARDAAIEKLERIYSLPVAKVGSYYRDEKNHPYTVIDAYIITREDEPTLTKIFQSPSMNADMIPDTTEKGARYVKIVTVRYLLLIHDIYYGEYERLWDDSNGRSDGPEEEYTETFMEGLESLYRRVDYLRTQVTYFATAPGEMVKKALDATSAILWVRTNGRVPGLYATVETRATYNAALGRAFGVIRGTLGQQYAGLSLGETPYVDGQPVPIGSIGELNDAPAPAAPAPPVPVAPVPDEEFDLDGGGLQSEGGVLSNAGGSSHGSSRRGLYSGLRKRGGSSTDSDV